MSIVRCLPSKATKASASTTRVHFVKSNCNAIARAIVLLALVGCNTGPAVVPVNGVVTRGGQPVRNATLSFYPGEMGRMSTAITDEQGRFELKYQKGTKGAAVGKHKVVVKFRPRSPQEEMDVSEGKLKLHPDQDIIEQKYGKLESTPLTVEITRAEENLQILLD